MNFSTLVDGFDQPSNALYRERETLIKSGSKITDLVTGTMAASDLQFPMAAIKRAFNAAIPKSRVYRPDPLGQLVAREAVSRFYREQGLRILSDQIMMTPGTSLSYWYAFKLLANAGDEILCPQPSYPLFDSIAALSGVRLVPYPLVESRGWKIDFEKLAAAVTERTRAIVLVSPHNPTGAVADENEIKALAALAMKTQLPIISDEVFSPFLFDREKLPRPAETQTPLVLTLNGFSKMFALPGMKIGWMAITGDADLVQKTRKALDVFSDTFLPVHETAQAAVPEIFRAGKSFLKRYRAEIKSRAGWVVDELSKLHGVSLSAPAGGFYLTVNLEGLNEEDICCELLKKHHVLTHPGYFYDLEGSHLVLSFVHESRVLRRGLKSLRSVLAKTV